MKRREALIGSAVLAGISANKVFAVDAKGSDKRFGDIIIPPEQEMGKEKHVPIIDAPSKVKAGEPFMVTVQVGKIVAHPNTVEHHIKWIQLYALEEDTQYAVQLGSFEFFPKEIIADGRNLDGSADQFHDFPGKFIPCRHAVAAHVV